MDDIRPDTPSEVPPPVLSVEPAREPGVSVKALRPKSRAPFLFLGLVLGLMLGSLGGAGVTLLIMHFWQGPNDQPVRNTAEAFLHSALAGQKQEAAQLSTGSYRNRLRDSNNTKPLIPQEVVIKHFNVSSCELAENEAWVKGTLHFGQGYLPSGSFVMSLTKEGNRWRVDSFSASTSTSGSGR
jgi:hypothetical protein